ncbi:MAG: GDP-mannose 4,6-dehydratase [Mycobacteriales bacterium]|nr:GDP-mannose 4,6-dehydratase [Mycobacteriales bacterium]
MTYWSDKRVLVTGATGMVGSWAVRRLVDEGAHVVCLVRDADPQSELLRSGTINRTTVVNGRLEDYDAVERSVNEHDVDTILHLGAQTIVGTAYRSPMQTLQANVAGTWNVLETARVHPGLVRRVVVASSDKAYGSVPDLPYREDMPLRGTAPYEVSKSCTDLVSTSYAVTYGTPVAIARCGNIYGGGDLNWSRIVPGTIRALLRGEQPVLRSDGTFLRDYLYVEDVVDAYLVTAQALDGTVAPGEAFNFSDEKPLSVMDIYAAVCHATVGEAVAPLVLGQAKDEIKDQYLDAAKARSALGWSVAWGLERGLTETVSWYRQLLQSRT